jgi:hypothetical protein
MSEENKETTFENRCNILSELWIEYRDEEDFKDFISYNDLGLPLAFMVSEGIVTANEKSKIMVNETFELFLATLGVEDNGFEDLDEMLVG